MSDYIDTKGIADRMGLERKYVTDKVVKRADFPRPAFALSQKAVRWHTADFEDWLRAKASRRSVRRLPGSTAAKASSAHDAHSPEQAQTA